MEETIARYEAEMEELGKSRKEIIRQAKEEAEHLLQESNARIESTIRTIKETQAEKEKTRLARKELTDFRHSIEDLTLKEQEGKITQKMDKLRQKQEHRKEKKLPPSLSLKTRPTPVIEGNMVRIKGQTSSGKVIEIAGKNAIVIFGNIKTTVKLERLEHIHPSTISPNEIPAKSAFVSTHTQNQMYEKKLEFKQDIDVRGMRGEEALQAITYFIDDAILVGIDRVRILHGTGTGILRTLIHQYLQTVSGIKHFENEHVQLGGAGVTVVDFF
ncbi:Endonuclease MutS2 [termite gut metagenome]|uniref:Endonuclease MutS2 n=1 Tax=termite gut metagenome TaxID=433724 RepID=A0A5J4S8W1_9ZZZZ